MALVDVEEGDDLVQFYSDNDTRYSSDDESVNEDDDGFDNGAFDSDLESDLNETIENILEDEFDIKMMHKKCCLDRYF